MKEYFDHYTGLKAAKDGEIYRPQSGKHKEHFTYGTLSGNKHLTVCYKWVTYPVHRIIAEVFLNGNKPIPKGYVVHHINENPEDNRVENLVILTKEEHKSIHGKEKTGEKNPMYGKFGEKHHNSKPIIGVHKETGKEAKFPCMSEAERVLGISVSNICNCLKGKLKSAGGYIWRYEKAPENSGASY